MTDWKMCRIVRAEISSDYERSRVQLVLETVEGRSVCIDHAAGGSATAANFIYCEDRYPFNSYRAGDYIEVDLDGTKYYNSRRPVDSESVVRKVSSSMVVRGNNNNAVIPSISQGQINTIIG